MAAISRHIHMQATFRWAPMNELAPDLTVRQQDEGNGTAGEEPMGLAFIDPADGECHIYVFVAEGKANLIRELTGGVIVP